MKVYHVSMPLMALGLLLAGLNVAVATLEPPDRSYNILMLTPISSKSHSNVFLPLATELVQRGHKVTLVNGYPPPTDAAPGITHIQPDITSFGEDKGNMFNIRDDTAKLIDVFSKELPAVARDIYKDQMIQKLYQRRNEFDLIVIDNMYNEVMYPFTHNKLFITIATSGLDPVHSAMMGNIQNPAYVVPNWLTDYPHPMNIIDRTKNLFGSIALPVIWNYVKVLPGIQEEISRQFPELPSIRDMERNQSLVLLNSHFSYTTSLPLVPGQIEVGGMHCRPGKPLPEDINSFLRGNEPVVYFSLGTMARGSSIPETYQKYLISAFAKLPYKFIWKFEEDIANLPTNVMIRKWLPQQDILAHPNVKVFISHCGQLSVQEAVYHGVPVLGLPVTSDQPKNAVGLERKGVAKMLRWEELSEKLLFNTIKELITNPSYLSSSSKLSKLFKDQPQPPVERAVYWTEYVIRHSGAVHLRSPERDLSWTEYLFLDIMQVVQIVGFVAFWITRKLYRSCFVSNASKKSKKKKKDE